MDETPRIDWSRLRKRRRRRPRLQLTVRSLLKATLVFALLMPWLQRLAPVASNEPLSPREAEGGRIGQPESPLPDSGNEVPQAEVREFTLRGLFAFVTAIAAYLSLGVTGVELTDVTPGLGALLVALGVGLAWIALYAIYRRFQRHVALAVHEAGLILGGGVTLVVAITMSASGGQDPSTALLATLAAACAGCLLGSLLSAPVFALTTLASLLRGAMGGPRA